MPSKSSADRCILTKISGYACRSSAAATPYSLKFVKLDVKTPQKSSTVPNKIWRIQKCKKQRSLTHSFTHP